MSGELVYIADLTVYDPSVGSEITLRYATRGFVTGPAETPANAFYDEKLKGPPSFKRSLFRDGATFGRSEHAAGELALLNGDGGLDALRAYGFDGRELVVRRGTFGAALSTFTTYLVATMLSAAIDNDRVRIQLRDRMLDLEVPLQATKYAGDNALPDGLEGVATDLKGKPKPVCLGVVKNISPPCVNTSKLIYQVNDGPVDSIDDVYDAGLAFGRDLYVVGTTGTNAYTSVDGKTWRARALPSASGSCEMFGVTQAGDAGVVVLAGNDGGNTVIYSSPEGVTWTRRLNTAGGSLRGACWSPDLALFVVVGIGGICYTSPDGITWTSRTSSFGANDIYGVCWSPELDLFVSVGAGDAGTPARIATSPDGINWTQRTDPLANNTSLFGVLWSERLDRYYAVGLVNTGPSPVAVYSADGITWTAITNLPTAVANDSLTTITQSATRIVASGNNGYIVSTDDGAEWSRRTVEQALGLFYGAHGDDVAGSPGVFVLSDSAASAVHISADGIGWTRYKIASSFPRGAGYARGLRAIEYYGSAADLLDDAQAPDPGAYKVWLDGGYFRLGATPASQITADVTEGDTAADRTHAQLFTRALSTRGYPMAQWNQDDIAALDVAQDAECGEWIGPEEPISVAALLDRIAMSAFAWWSPDRTGVLRLGLLVVPPGSPVLSLVEDQVLKLARRQPSDAGRGIPPWRSVVRYARNHTVQTSDLAGGVSDDRRAELAREWREAVEENTAIQTAHPLAPEIIEDSLIATEAEAEAEATRRQNLRDGDPDVFDVRLEQHADLDVLDLGAELNLTHSRHGLSAGRNLIVIGLDEQPEQHRVTATLWGTT